jgi:carbon monoxide dehydrogenase subunit G
MNSIVVPAPVDAVWAKLRDFHDMSWASPVIESLEPQGGASGAEIGAKRLLNGCFAETLLCLDDAERVVRYSIDAGPGTPVEGTASYVGVVRAFPVTDADHTFVIWTSSWTGGEGVAEFCNAIYVALLQALKGSFQS